MAETTSEKIMETKTPSPKAPLRRHRIKTALQQNQIVKEEQKTNEECLARLEVPQDKCLLRKSDSPKSRSRTMSECELKKQKMVEQLQLDNVSFKKALEGERSALRELKAQHEAETRRERAEARRREASLEGQLRSALKGCIAVPSPAGDNAIAASLEAIKASNKCLQRKLQVLTEADKRKAGELRAQHEAHVHQLQQLEKKARAQTAQLLEELKAKERQLSQATGRTPIKGNRGAQGVQNVIKGSVKMGVAEQLHLMEGQISRLESELQRRDDIIHSLRNSKSKKEKPLDSQQFGKDSISKDTISDVDSAVSSGPNSLSPQPSPDLWFQSREASLSTVEENMLEAARRQIQELEMSLSISKAGHQSAQLRATQLEEQLQDLREHADLLEFRCLELEDSSEKRNSLEEMNSLDECDSGCTSPEVCLKTSVSPPLRRSDSGYKSPTHRPSSPKLKNPRVLRTPTISVSDNSFTTPSDSSHSTNTANALRPSLDESNQNDDIKDRLERILLRTTSVDDRNCLEEILRLLWNIQTLSTSFIEDDFSTGKSRRIDTECTKTDIEQVKGSKIIATISPYSQKSNEITKSPSGNEVDLLEIKAESKKLLLGLQESGIFDESDWDNKSTQTEWCDFGCVETESDLTTEVQRLNQIREELEKSGAIRNKKLGINKSSNDDVYYEYYHENEGEQYMEKRYIEFYENRIALLENKISIYESSNDIRDKKLAQRLQREINLQSKIKALEADFKKLTQKYAVLEEEHCELEEAENDTRLHCQVLQTEFEIQSAKLRDLDEERSCARNEADCYRALVDEYENKSTYLQEQEKELKERIKVMENAVPALVFWNIYKIIDKYPDFDFKAAYKAKFDNLSLGLESGEELQPEIVAMIDFLSNQSDEMVQITNFEEHLQSFGENDGVNGKYKLHEDILRSKMAAIEKIVLENSVLCKKQEEASANRIKALEEELKSIKENSTDRTIYKNHSCDNECKLKIQSLMDKEAELKERIKALENREVVLLMTLTQADEMWAGVENKYKVQIKQYEESEAVLKEQMSECENEKNKWKTKCEPLEQKVCELEESESKLEIRLKKLTHDNKELMSKSTILEDQIIILKSELQQSKEQVKHMQDKHKNELLLHKKKVGVAQEELQVQKKQQIDVDEVHNSKLSLIKKQLSKTNKDLQELEVTNGELKEEVETLEKEVQKLSIALSKQQCKNEEQMKLLLEELTNKSKEAESLKKELKECQRLPSAQEELELVTSQKNMLLESESSFNSDYSSNCSTLEREINREKPALPKRKPKLSPEYMKLKLDEHKAKMMRNTKLSKNDVNNFNECIKDNVNNMKEENNCSHGSCNEDCANCGKKAAGLLQQSLSIIERSTGKLEESKRESSVEKDDKSLPWKPKPFQSITPNVPLVLANNHKNNVTNETSIQAHNDITSNKLPNDSIVSNIKETSPTVFQKHPNKNMGVFVFDRVSKLLNPPNPEYQPIIKEENNKMIGKSVYIYNL